MEISKEIYEKAKKAKLKEILESLDEKGKSETKENIEIPKKEVVTESISGIDILEIENAVEVLWSEGIYAESAMGCTGPMVMISSENLEKSKKILEEKEYI